MFEDVTAADLLIGIAILAAVNTFALATHAARLSSLERRLPPHEGEGDR